MLSEPNPELPSDYEAEKKLIGSILLSPEIAGPLAGKLRQEDFYVLEFGQMFAAACDLAALNRPISPATVLRQVPQGLLDSFGGQPQVVACMEGVLHGEADFWLERVLVMARARKLFKAGELASRYALGDPAKVDEGYSKVESLLSSARTADESFAMDMMEGVALFRERMAKYLANPDALTGMATDWRSLDYTLDGLRPGAVTTVYARSGAFKTWCVSNIGWRLSRMAIPGYWVTTESQQVDVMERLHSLEAGVNIREVRFRHEIYRYQQLIEEAGYRVEGYPIFVNPSTEIDIAALKGFVGHLVRTKDIQYLIVDLLDHVRSSRHRDLEEEEYVMYQMKDIAKRFNIHVILTTHIRKTDKFMAPTIAIDPSEMKGASSKMQDSDALLSLVPVRYDDPHAEAQAFPPKPMTRDEIMAAQAAGEPMLILMGVTKNRHGPERNLLFEIDMAQGGRMEPVAG